MEEYKEVKKVAKKRVKQVKEQVVEHVEQVVEQVKEDAKEIIKEVKVKKPNNWITHVKEVAESNNMSYRNALKIAGQTYTK